MTSQSDKAYQATYRAKHRDCLRVSAAVWRANHKDRTRAYELKYRRSHREEIRARSVAQWASNPWRRAESARTFAATRARKYGLDPGLLTKEVFARIHLLPCAYCGVTPSLGADHVVPLARGGPNSIENLVPACLPCNTKKNVRPYEMYARA